MIVSPTAGPRTTAAPKAKASSSAPRLKEPTGRRRYDLFPTARSVACTLMMQVCEVEEYSKAVRLVEIAVDQLPDSLDAGEPEAFDTPARNVAALLAGCSALDEDMFGDGSLDRLWTVETLMQAVAELSNPTAPDRTAESLNSAVEKALAEAQAISQGKPTGNAPASTTAAPKGQLTAQQLRTVLEHIAGRAEELYSLLMLTQRTDGVYDCSVLVNSAVAQCCALGAMADDAGGASVIGGFRRWHYGPNFAGEGVA